jgi:hypothetical protein
MAGFTTMALLGLAAGTGVFAGKKLAPKPTTQSTAANATPTPTITPPPTAAQSTAQNVGTAQQAAKKVRRKLTKLGSGGAMSTPGQSLITPTTEPKSLLGY